MKILVTGGAGFIGSNFIRYILTKYPEYEVVCIDKLSYAGNLSSLKPILTNERFNFYKIDITDRKNIYKVFEKTQPEIVINFAAESHVDRSIDDPEVFFHTNILGTTILMDASLKYKVKRFHQISTDEVYGDLPLNQPDLLFNERMTLEPSSPYSSSKAAADLYVLAYHRTYKLPIIISRCSNNYGPYQFPEKLIPLTIINALNDQFLPVYGDGKNVRDWLHVDDHCRALDLLLHKGKIGEIYNIGGNNERANIDIVQMICELAGKSENLIKYVADRKGHDLRYAVDSTKIQKELGWSPKISFKEGIKKTVQWYTDNENWWKELVVDKQ